MPALSFELGTVPSTKVQQIMAISTRQTLTLFMFAGALCVLAPQSEGAPLVQSITLKSGQAGAFPGIPWTVTNTGSNDSTFRSISIADSEPISGSPLGSTDFSASINGSFVPVITPRGNWIDGLDCDPDARWINFALKNATFGAPGSALYGGEFISPFGGPAMLQFCWAVDEELGDPASGQNAGPNTSGVYLNGTALNISGGSFGVESVANVPVTLNSGTNTLCIYQRETGCCYSGIIFSATFTAVSSFTNFCKGDGGNQVGCTNCPCGNNASPGTCGGCLNSAGTSARLLPSGSASIGLGVSSTADLRFGLTGAPPLAFAILLSGGAVAPNNPANPCFPFQSGIQSLSLDGLRCVVTDLWRHGGRQCDVNGDVGVTNSPWGGEGGPPVGILNQSGFMAGQVRYFQSYYRDDAKLVCMRGINTSQAVCVTVEN